ncbi:hypothetical protein [Nocardioides speluncae]|uniref:hypothetical protein n=1 Tax=Nocardioides speluncae TaxID=2670337 RepID=UPI000D69F9DA|nr:hypothetical protein [Nocardioides speluncae]
MDKTTALHMLLGWAASLTLVTVAAVLASPAASFVADAIPVAAAPLRLTEFAVLPADVRDGLARRLSVLRTFFLAGPPSCCHRA